MSTRRIFCFRTGRFFRSLCLPGVISRRPGSRRRVGWQAARPCRHVCNWVTACGLASRKQVGNGKQKYKAGLHRFSSKPNSLVGSKSRPHARRFRTTYAGPTTTDHPFLMANSSWERFLSELSARQRLFTRRSRLSRRGPPQKVLAS
jgi:hypothetical protein